MSDILQKIQGYYEENSNQPFDIPEMDLTLYHGPLTAKDVGKDYNRIQKGDMGAMVNVLIKTAKDENGEQVFTLKDKPVLMRTFPLGVLNSYLETVIGDQESVDDISGN